LSCWAVILFSIFNLVGYVSSPMRTRLGIRTYERLAMLSCLLLRKVSIIIHIDEQRSNGLRRNTSANDARRAPLEKRKKMMKTLSTSAGTWNVLLKLNLLECWNSLLFQMICQWKSLLMQIHLLKWLNRTYLSRNEK